MLDTAVGYGLSENTLGLMVIKNLELGTKFPKFQGECVLHVWVSTQISESCMRLRKYSAYGVLNHSLQQLGDANGVGLFRAWQLLKD